ncbi:hypothetical protein RBH29_11200 [Herbivorax sp. ANBcel31]|uniref:hypothetical protein n=1 Tax=Herbivorax sp. ANBcel31 TaxID=3069754 RepID=UPI0027B28238|nr:hypothetical protein [Herbivorax sp. ANBcel31]MDQ2086993.1 hypothetical protein [Herbivorax sp. ANBcel31]
MEIYTDEDIKILKDIIEEGTEDIPKLLRLVADINEDGVIDEDDLILLKEIVSIDLIIEKENWYTEGVRGEDLEIESVAKLFLWHLFVLQRHKYSFYPQT